MRKSPAGKSDQNQTKIGPRPIPPVAPPDIPLDELQRRLLYAVIVAGKSAKFADRAMQNLDHLLFRHNHILPFEALRVLASVGPGRIDWLVHAARTGNYRKMARSFHEIAHAGLNLDTCSIAELEKLHGIGPKTSRFWLMWTRPNERLAALDVHVLRWLGSRGHKVPRSTPQPGPEYDRLQEIFIREADDQGMTPRELDWSIWVAGSGYLGEVQSES